MNIIFPTPREVTDSGKYVRIGALSSVAFKLKTKGAGEIFDSAIEYITEKFNDLAAITPEYIGKYVISLTVNSRDVALKGKGEEAYRITIDGKEAKLVALHQRGALYAAITLMELVEIKGEGVYLPVCEIVDYPKFTKRGVMIESRYNDFMTLDDYKSAVDDFAKLKMNKMQVAVYGCWSMQYDGKLSEQQYIPFKSIPEFNNPKNRRYYSVKQSKWINIPETQCYMYSEDFFGEVIKYGKRKNVEVFPLFNSFGHNTLLPRIKPEISAKDENGNPTCSGFCTSNEETYNTVFKLYDEIIDRYLQPNGITSISVGLDEVRDSAFCKCEGCRDKDKKDIFIDHAIRLLRYLKSRGMKEVYVYDDMFLYIFDNLNEELADRFKAAGVYDIMVMDWWNYGAGVDFFRGLTHKVGKFFDKSITRPMSGYWHWQGWTDCTPNIAETAAIAEKYGFDGMISYSSYEPCLDYNYAYLADAAWYPVKDKEKDPFDFARRYIAKHYPDNFKEAYGNWMHIRHRLHPYNYEENPPHNSEFAQYIYSYKKAGMDYPRNHIAEIMEKIKADEPRLLAYLEELYERSTSALKFFDSDKANPSAVNDNFIATIAEQQSYANEMLTLYKMYCDSPKGTLSNSEMRELIQGLIRSRKKQMHLIEEARIECMRHQALRMMTINLEYLWELLEKLEEADSEGRQFIFDPVTAIDRSAPVFKFLR